MSYKKDIQQAQFLETRRNFLRTTTKGLGAASIGSLILPNLLNGQTPTDTFSRGTNGVLKGLHHIAKAKRVIYLFQSGGPSQIE